MNQDQFGGQNLQTNPIPPAGQSPLGGAVSPEPTVPPPASGGWAPAPESAPAPASTPIPISTPPPPVSSNPFETTPPPIPPVSGPTQPMGNEGMMEPAAPKSSLPLIIILAILIILGGLFFASWMGWISLFGLEKLWDGGKTETSITETPIESNVNVNDAKRKEDLANLKTALTAYYLANQSYPVAATTEKTLDSVALKVLVPDYLSALPVDPLSPTKYYGYKSDGATFELTAVLEDTTDPAGITVGTVFLYKITNSSADTPTTSGSSSTNTPTSAPSTSAPATTTPTSSSASSNATTNTTQ